MGETDVHGNTPRNPIRRYNRRFCSLWRKTKMVLQAGGKKTSANGAGQEEQQTQEANATEKYKKKTARCV